MPLTSTPHPTSSSPSGHEMAAQAEHAVLPISDANSPAPHALHAVAVSFCALNVPAEQGSHRPPLVPSQPTLRSPPSHGAHATHSPVRVPSQPLRNKPSPQGTQLLHPVLPCCEYMPELHARQASSEEAALFGEYLPAAHLVQLEARTGAKVPA